MQLDGWQYEAPLVNVVVPLQDHLAPCLSCTSTKPSVGVVPLQAHIVRAMLEAICFQTRDVMEAMRLDADMQQLKALFVDGGASKNALLMQVRLHILCTWAG